MMLLLRETHHRIRRAHRPPSRVHDVPIVVHDARSRCLESLLCLAVLLEEARDVRARQAGGARARVALVHELQDLRWRLVQAVRRGRREGLAEQRLEILRPRQALLGRSRGAVRAAFRGVRAARAPLGGRLRRGTLRRTFPAWRVFLTRRGARRARGLVVVVAGGALLLGGVEPEFGSDPTVVPPVRPRLAEVLRPLVHRRWRAAAHRDPLAVPSAARLLEGRGRNQISRPRPNRERNFDTGARPVHSPGALARISWYGESVRACERAHRPPRDVSAAGRDEST